MLKRLYYEHNEAGSTLCITDHTPTKQSYALKLALPNGMVKETNVAHTLQPIHTLLVDALYVHTEDALDGIHFFESHTHNKTRLSGQGKSNLYLPYACDTQADCDNYAQIFQEQIDWQRELTTLTTPMIGIQPGDIISFKNNDIPFLVLNVAGDGSETQSQHMPINAANQLAQSELILMPINYHYRLPHELIHMICGNASNIHNEYFFLNKDNNLPQLFFQQTFIDCPELLTAHISNGKQDPAIDSDACYRVTFPFAADKHSPAFKLLQLSTNPANTPAYGFHFPLYENTEVIIAFINDCRQRPLILGALHDKTHTDPVTNKNPSQHKSFPI